MGSQPQQGWGAGSAAEQAGGGGAGEHQRQQRTQPAMSCESEDDSLTSFIACTRPPKRSWIGSSRLREIEMATVRSYRRPS